MSPVLTREFTSSDEEGVLLYEEESHRVRYQRQIRWESAQLTKAKEELDKTFLQLVASNKQRDSLMTIKRGERLSERKLPANTPAWVIHPDHLNI